MPNASGSAVFGSGVRTATCTVVVEGGGQLPAGVRATPGTVGFLGAQSSLTLLQPGDPLPSEWGNASWDGAALTTRSPLTIDGYDLRGIVFDNYAPVTVRNGRIHSPAMNWRSFAARQGITCHDVTFTADPPIGPNEFLRENIVSDAPCDIRRCDFSGAGDALHVDAGAYIDQVVVHDLVYANEDQHIDGVQWYNGVGGTSQLLNSHITNVRPSPTAPNGPSSSFTCGHAPTQVVTGRLDAICKNNYFRGGINVVRFENGLNVTFEDNDLYDDVDTNGSAYARGEQTTIVSWERNYFHHANGGVTLIPPTYIPS